MRVLGIDYGRARIGVALGDTETKIASPWAIIAARDLEFVRRELATIIAQEGVERVVVGIPRRLHDQSEESTQAKEILTFVELLRADTWEVVTENETWSTKIAARQQQELGQKGKRDDLAATAILQSYLDRYGLSS